MCNAEYLFNQYLGFMTSGNYSSGDYFFWNDRVQEVLKDNDLDEDDATRQVAQELEEQISEGVDALLSDVSIYSDVIGLALSYLDYEAEARSLVSEQLTEWDYSGELTDLQIELGLIEEDELDYEYMGG